MVGEVDEAGGLETVEDGLGGGEALGGHAVLEEGEIYELCDWTLVKDLAIRDREVTGMKRLSLSTALV